MIKLKKMKILFEKKSQALGSLRALEKQRAISRVVQIFVKRKEPFYEKLCEALIFKNFRK